MQAKDSQCQDFYDKILNALRNEDHSKGKPFSVRFSETTAREIEAEARLTRRTASDVIKDRMAFGLLTDEERDPHLSHSRRCLMPAIVDATDDGLQAKMQFLRERIEKARSNGVEPQHFLTEELRLCETELDLRKAERTQKKQAALLAALGLNV